jgi:phosphotransferase system  glucose/maltose/N-acetylglucosamine-specific IIC component
MILHMVQGPGDDNLALLSEAYRIPAKDIGIATFGQWSTSVIYNWLKNNGGIPQRKDSSVPTGYHWSFAPMMVVNIPGAGESLSPPVDGAIRGGPNVSIPPDLLVGIVDRVDPNPNQSDMAQERQQSVAAAEEQGVPSTSSSTSKTSLASFFSEYGAMFLLAGAAIGLLWLGDDGKGKGSRKKRTTTRKAPRKTARRTARRNKRR